MLKSWFWTPSEFSYLGSQINYTDTRSSDTQVRILSGKLHLHKINEVESVYKLSKLEIYGGIIRPVVTYVNETWVL